MGDMTILLLNAALTAFGFFVAAPIFLSSVSTFTVQKKFAETMVQEKIIKEEKVREIQPKKQIAGVIITVIVFAAAVFTALKINFGMICLVVGFAAGLLKFRKTIQFNTLTVKRFQNTYAGSYDEAKLKKYVNKIF